MNPRVAAVVRKEVREYRRNRLILLTMLLLPTFFLVIPLIGVIVLPGDAPEEAILAVTAQSQLLFLLIPVILPTTIAAYTVIGEREQGTLEPLLSTPATDEEILRGKAIAATVPSALLAWLLFGVFVGVSALLAADRVRDEILDPAQILAQVLLAPVLAVFAIEVGMAISVRSSDIRVAQQLSGLAMLPVFGAIFLFSYEIIDPSVGRYLLAAAVVAVVDVAGWRLVVPMFDRERLLTRYGGT